MITDHSPAQVIAKLLFDQGVFDAPPSDEWPLYVGHLPGDKTVRQAASIVDTAAQMEGRILATGEVIEHPGLQIRTRSSSHPSAYQKVVQAAEALSGVNRIGVRMEDGTWYTVHAASRFSSILAMGLEEETRLWNFSVNYTITISDLLVTSVTQKQHGLYDVHLGVTGSQRGTFDVYLGVVDKVRGTYDVLFPEWPDVPTGDQFLHELENWLPDGTPSVIVGNMGADLSGTGKWTFAPTWKNGKLYGIPTSAEDILIIDTNPLSPDAGTATRSNMGEDLSGAGKWAGGVSSSVDERIYGIPHGATEILIIDPATSSAVKSNLGADLSGTVKWNGGAEGVDGKIYGCPFQAPDILIIDPAAGTATRSNMGVSMPDPVKWAGLVPGVDGKLYGIPCFASDILIIDPVAGTATRSNMGASLAGMYKWMGGVAGPDGKIYGIPLHATDILIIDPVAGTATKSNMGADLSGTFKWSSGSVGTDGRIYGTPYDAEDILIIDPVAGTATRSNMGADLSGSNKWAGMGLGFGGVLYGIPYTATQILQINAAGTGADRSALADMSMCPFLNKF